MLNAPIPILKDEVVVLSQVVVKGLDGHATGPSEDYFCYGMTEETIAALGTLSPQNLAVFARTSAMAYRNTTKSISDIGRELAVDYVLGKQRTPGGQSDTHHGSVDPRRCIDAAAKVSAPFRTLGQQKGSRRCRQIAAKQEFDWWT